MLTLFRMVFLGASQQMEGGRGIILRFNEFLFKNYEQKCGRGPS